MDSKVTDANSMWIGAIALFGYLVVCALLYGLQ